MERRKAWDPTTYIPYIASNGRSWGRHALEEGCERFFRASEQQAWTDKTRGEIVEDVSMNNLELRIFFLGRPRIVDERGKVIIAGHNQPLFHVEHAAEGSEQSPINVWRVVMLTEDEAFKEKFEKTVPHGFTAGYLPTFVERYIQFDMRVQIERK
jgi:hypothetical protein